jgi:hypothetical protein
MITPTTMPMMTPVGSLGGGDEGGGGGAGQVETEPKTLVSVVAQEQTEPLLLT